MEVLSKRGAWTHAENKRFEDALAMYDKDTPERWEKVANMIPGKSVGDVIRQYRELEDDVSKIEAGLLPVREYSGVSPFLVEWENRHCGDGYSVGVRRGNGPGARPSELERKKGVPWTEDEHKLFLMGLRKYGKGDWRNISRNFVVTRTPTQVASHAQKYFLRQLSGAKDKRRASIHDITTINLESRTCADPSPETKTHDNAPSAAFNSMQVGVGAGFGSTYRVGPYGNKMQGHHHQQHGHIGHHLNMGF